LGKLHAASCAATASHQLNIDINGPAVGSYDQLELDAAPNLAATLLGTALGNGFNPTNGQQFIIVRNNSGLPIAAPFLNAAEGAQFYVDNTHRMQITYLGGDGNDVVLTAVASVGQFKGVSTDGNRFYINGCGTPGANYTIEANANLSDPLGWTNIGTVSMGMNGLMQFVDSDMSHYPMRFYRFVAP